MLFMASTRSRSTRMRTRGSVPWWCISVRFQPAPTPNSSRPPERWSTLATSFAVMIGSRSMTRQMPLATRSRVVAAAAAVSATNRSYVFQYFDGSGLPGARSVSVAGMWVCSAKYSASWPRSSTNRATSPGFMPSNVGKMPTPNSMGTHDSRHAAEHAQQVLLAVERVGVPPLAGRCRPAHRRVVVEGALQHALALREPGQPLLELVHPRRRDVALEHA